MENGSALKYLLDQLANRVSFDFVVVAAAFVVFTVVVIVVAAIVMH